MITNPLLARRFFQLIKEPSFSRLRSPLEAPCSPEPSLIITPCIDMPDPLLLPDTYQPRRTSRVNGLDYQGRMDAATGSPVLPAARTT